MRIYKLSDNFSPLHEGVRFGIDTESDIPIDFNVEIIDVIADEVVATKLVRSTISTVVNIAPYITLADTYTPSLERYIHFVDIPTAAYKIRIDDIESEEIVVSVNRNRMYYVPAIATSFPLTRQIAYGESDEVMMMVPKESSIHVEIVTDNDDTFEFDYTSEGEMVSIVISPDEFSTEMQHFDVTLYCNDEDLGTLHYKVASHPKKSVRLAWLSNSGAIEQYTFPCVSKSVIAAEKRNFMTSDGVCSVRSQAKQTLTLCSQFEPRATIEALADLIAASKVWIKLDEDWKLVEVTTSQVEYDLFGQPNYLSLEVCLWQEEVL